VISPRNWILTTAIVAAVSAMPLASMRAQAVATTCKDGTTATASGRGACSRHGGVNKAAVKQQKKVVTTEVKAAKSVANRTSGAQVTRLCADGTTSNSTGRGTCSGHGGVKGAEVTSKTTGATIPAPSTAVAPRNSTPVPRASATARTRANANSAVVAGSGAADDNNPVGAIARCKDGLYSHAVHRRGACGHHRGVATWM